MTDVSLDEYASLEAMKAEHRKLLRHLAREREDRVDLEKTIERAARASFGSLEAPVATKPKVDGRKKGEEYAVIMDADWQLGKVTESYDSDVTRRRVEEFTRKAIELTEIQRADHPVRHARLWLLGDLVEGEDIFPGQAWHIDSSLVDQVVTNGMSILRDQVYTLLHHFDTVHVAGAVGNHGRLGRPGQYHPDSNMDRMLYLVTKLWFEAAGETRVTFNVPRAGAGSRGWYAADQIGKYRSLLVHGDQFRGGNSFGGLPYYSFNKKALLWRDMSLSGDLPMFQDIACGHWHRNVKIPVGSMRVRVAGTPESGNDWSAEVLAVTSAPSQHVMFVHPEAGMVTSEYEVFLT